MEVQVLSSALGGIGGIGCAGKIPVMPVIEPRPLEYFADVRTGTYHSTVECPDYTLPRQAWSAYPYYQQEI